MYQPGEWEQHQQKETLNVMENHNCLCWSNACLAISIQLNTDCTLTPPHPHPHSSTPSLVFTLLHTLTGLHPHSSTPSLVYTLTPPPPHPFAPHSFAPSLLHTLTLATSLLQPLLIAPSLLHTLADPYHERALANQRYFESLKENSPDTFVDQGVEEEKKEQTSEHARYEALCREPEPIVSCVGVRM